MIQFDWFVGSEENYEIVAKIIERYNKYLYPSMGFFHKRRIRKCWN